MMLGPGLVMGGAAIGGGEWLTGPMVTAKYGGARMWLATLSILGQVVYNIEISRYTLYTGEPIFTGKFRTPPGPKFWVCVYLLLDFGSIFPYLAAFAATPLATAIMGEVPRPEAADAFVYPFGIELSHKMMLRLTSYCIFLGALVPLIFGGKIFGPARLGAIAGLISSFHMAAGGIGALAGAVIFDQWGSYDRAFVLMMALSVVASAVTLMIREQRLTFVPRPA